MGAAVEDYFCSIFTFSRPSDFDSILQGIHLAISKDAAGCLGCEFHVDEVWVALKKMAPLTAPGPYGMLPIFYKSFWHIVGEDVTTVVLKVLNSSVVPESLNFTFIALIPKVEQLRKVSDFRLISLCNVVYKLISKVLVNRLNFILAKAIPESQSSFLSRRLIYDNVLVAFETLHYLKKKTQGKLGYMALKLDISKAYDRVEW